mmetsp:Transcript_3945/g.5199  ORF Transcript_3945/g.5199 Transcript_3945/m.5199 type:complete len:174 (-) Transcript_3945:81-602(-)|eukprot:CAMPEP_0198146734 /NCGR_PEP_ID=MMETSP1443-20131203/31155_1 /TAXON_ID=186043 /ORGANISM="Entomoneis sp., Strain CCMP2396" /LENGTH=173 /DNA_ID=CAMNT_0043810795 /DNA_START=78 /DNA_END=599 /DNA_ORIENTATION=+
MVRSLFTIATWLLLFGIALDNCHAWSSSSGNGTRRSFLSKSLVAATIIIAQQEPQPAQAVVGAAPCASGVGAGCDDLSEGNDFIRELQEKSAVNKDRNEKEARDAYYMKNYPDWFQSVGKTLVKKASDGTFLALDAKEVEALQKANKLTLEIPKSLGGRIVDLTQKPILVLRE